MNETTKTLHVEGMSCQNCVTHVKEALDAVDGVQRTSINLGQKQVTIDFLPKVTNLKALETAVSGAGYEVVGVVEAATEDESKSCLCFCK